MCNSAEKERADQADFQVAMTQKVCDREKQQEKSRDQPTVFGHSTDLEDYYNMNPKLLLALCK